MLYPNPSVTADLIKTGRYQSILTRLKPELDYLWAWLVGDLHSADGRSEELGGLDPELQELMWRVDFDYVRWVAVPSSFKAVLPSMTAILQRLRSRQFFQTELTPSGYTPTPLRCAQQSLGSCDRISPATPRCGSGVGTID